MRVKSREPEAKQEEPPRPINYAVVQWDFEKTQDSQMSVGKGVFFCLFSFLSFFCFLFFLTFFKASLLKF